MIKATAKTIRSGNDLFLVLQRFITLKILITCLFGFSPNEGDRCKHRPPMHPGPYNILEPSADIVNTGWHEAFERHTPGEKVAEWFVELNSFNLPFRKILFKSFPIPFKYNPGQSQVGPGQWPTRRRLPVLGVQTAFFEMEETVHDTGPVRDPRFDHNNGASRFYTETGIV